MARLEEGDIVSCVVERIAGTTVFVKIDGNREGNIIVSEIAPGRIRNLRDYVVPKKRIICKVLRISGDRVDLSLRRVTPKEQKEVLELAKQEKSAKSIMKSVLGEKTEEIVNKILEEEKIYDFLQEAKENSSKLEKLVGKKEADKILEIVNSQKKKKAIIKKEIHLTTTKSNGLEEIKNILGKIKDAEIKYVSAGKYSIKTEADDLKAADNKIKDIVIQIEKQIKGNDFEFELKEK